MTTTTEPRTSMAREMLADERFHGGACASKGLTGCTCGMDQNLAQVEVEAAAAPLDVGALSLAVRDWYSLPADDEAEIVWDQVGRFVSGRYAARLSASTGRPAHEVAELTDGLDQPSGVHYCLTCSQPLTVAASTGRPAETEELLFVDEDGREMLRGASTGRSTATEAKE